jgi:hypothetical protein
MGAALSGILRSSGTDPAAFAKKVSGLIADDPAVAKALTVKEREDIRNNPDKLADYRKQFANSSTKKYEAFVQAMNQASSTVTADFEKESASKPELIRASADLRVASDTIKAMQKDFQFSPAVEGDAFKAYSDAAKPAPPAGPPQRNFTLPRGTGQPTAAAAPPPPVQSDGTPGGFLTYGLGPAARSLYNSAPVQGALEGLGRATIYPSAPAPAAPVLQPSPGVPTDPSVLSTLRLKRFLQDSATQNNSLFPTAFPAAPDLISPLPGP